MRATIIPTSPYVAPGLELKIANLEDIEKIVCGYFQITQNDFRNHFKSREMPYVMIRQVLVYMSRIFTKHSTTEIGKFIDRDHATILYSIKKVNDIIEYKQKPYYYTIELIEEYLSKNFIKKWMK